MIKIRSSAGIQIVGRYDDMPAAAYGQGKLFMKKNTNDHKRHRVTTQQNDDNAMANTTD